MGCRACRYQYGGTCWYLEITLAHDLDLTGCPEHTSIPRPGRRSHGL